MDIRLLPPIYIYYPLDYSVLCTRCVACLLRYTYIPYKRDIHYLNNYNLALKSNLWIERM